MKGAKVQEEADLRSSVSSQMMTATMTSELGVASHQDSMRNMAKSIAKT